MISEQALINNKVVSLSKDEQDKAEKFHKSRCAFAWVNGKLIFNENPDDGRDHQHWLLEDYGITEEQFEHINRGYMIPERIQLFIGSGFKPVNLNTIKYADIIKLVKIHNKRYATREVIIYNGVNVGKIGEVWTPIDRVGIIKL